MLRTAYILGRCIHIEAYNESESSTQNRTQLCPTSHESAPDQISQHSCSTWTSADPIILFVNQNQLFVGPSRPADRYVNIVINCVVFLRHSRSPCRCESSSLRIFLCLFRPRVGTFNPAKSEGGWAVVQSVASSVGQLAAATLSCRPDSSLRWVPYCISAIISCVCVRVLLLRFECWKWQLRRTFVR